MGYSESHRKECPQRRCLSLSSYPPFPGQGWNSLHTFLGVSPMCMCMESACVWGGVGLPWLAEVCHMEWEKANKYSKYITYSYASSLFVLTHPSLGGLCWWNLQNMPRYLIMHNCSWKILHSSTSCQHHTTIRKSHQPLFFLLDTKFQRIREVLLWLVHKQRNNTMCGKIRGIPNNWMQVIWNSFLL